MDEVEAVALRALGAREIWDLDELPAGVDVNVLRCLDADRLIEVRFVVMQNVARFRGDPTPPVPSRHEWFSPILRPTMGGDWDEVIKRTTRDTWHHPNQLRLTDTGKAALARLQRTPMSSTNGQATATPIGELGTAFLSEKDLAEQFKVCRNTLRSRLRAWRPHHMNGEWHDVPDRRPRDPKYLYQVRSVMPIIDSLPKTGERPAKKKSR